MLHPTEAYLWDSTHSCGDDHEASSSSLYNGHTEGLCQGCIDEDVTPHLPMQSSQQCRHVLLHKQCHDGAGHVHELQMSQCSAPPTTLLGQNYTLYQQNFETDLICQTVQVACAMVE